MRSCKRSLQWNCGGPTQPPSLTRDCWRRCLPIFILLLIFGMLIRYTNPTVFLFEGFHGAMCKWEILNPIVLLLQDFCGTVRGIAKFLEKPLSESQLKQLEQHCSLDNMRNNDSVNYSWNRGIWSDGEFLRKGWNTLRRNFCRWVCLGQHRLNPLFSWHPSYNYASFVFVFFVIEHECDYHVCVHRCTHTHKQTQGVVGFSDGVGGCWW